MVGAPHEARFIVDEALGLGLPLGHPAPPTGALDADVVTAARAMAARRAAGEPLQYIFGHWPFRSLDLLVDPRVLIPRPETEQVVEVALAEARRLFAEPGAGRARGGRRRHRLGCHRAVAGHRARAVGGGRGLGDRRRAPARSPLRGPMSNGRVRSRAVPPVPMARVELVGGDWLEPLPASASRPGVARGDQPAVRE